MIAKSKNTLLTGLVKIAAEEAKNTNPGFFKRLWDYAVTTPIEKYKEAETKRKEDEFLANSLVGLGVGSGVGLGTFGLARALGAGYGSSTLTGVGTGLLATILAHKNLRDQVFGTTGSKLYKS